ncbi:MAG: SpoIID/LytB domain-containing protein [Chloroflexota bacterium]
MPIVASGAHPASPQNPLAGVLLMLRSPRAWVVILLALVAPFGAAPLDASPAALASGTCTGWNSRVTPPSTIRVLRTGSHRVETVQLETYVVTVMASGEWPSNLPPAALEVGATAVKQYAWYYALRGNHRPGYRTRGGACYDVRDDTRDQLYRPEIARPTQKQLDALAATWALSLRKHDRFFLTGYRNGGNVNCAKDADGWRLYQQSLVNCAYRGWSRTQIQQRYYGRGLSAVWDLAPQAGATGEQRILSSVLRRRTPADPVGPDRLAPVLLTPRLELAPRAPLDRAPGMLTWSAADAGTGIGSFEVQRRTSRGWVDVAVTTRPGARQTRVPLGGSVEFRVRARDRVGNLSDWASVRAGASIRQDSAAAWSGAWHVVHDPDALGGTLRRTTRDGARARLRFDGTGVGVVAATGPGMGTLRIRMGGRTVARIDLGALPASSSRVVWTRSWPGLHHGRIDLQVGRLPGRSHVDIDAFVLLH